MKLTKREKILLYGLSCVVLVAALLFLVLMPTLEKNTKLRSDYTAISTRLRQLNNSELLSDQEFLQESSKYTEDIETAKQKIFVGLASEDVDRIITELVLTHKLKPVSMAITKETEEVINYSEYIKNNENEENGLENSDEVETDDESSKTSTVFTASLEVEGDFTNSLNLLDSINGQKTMKVTSIDFNVDTANAQRISLVIKVYTI